MTIANSSKLKFNPGSGIELASTKILPGQASLA
jgi:hypothetical protein